jgi:cytosine/adenosine deaminase-related metal-dependent hydrolase
MPSGSAGGDQRVVDLVIDKPECVVYSGSSWGSPGYVAVDGGRILPAEGRDPPPARRRIDGQGTLVTPGFVNTHHHLFQNLARAYAPTTSRGLSTWLDGVYELWPRVDHAAMYDAAWVACAELLLGGCTTTVDHLSLPAVPASDPSHAVVAAARETGIRLHLVRGFMDRPPGAAGSSFAGTWSDYVEVVERLARAQSDVAHGNKLTVGVGAATLFSTSPGAMRDLAALARCHGMSRHVHAAEVEDEARSIRNWWNCTPVERLRDLDWLGEDVWLAHAVWLSDRDIGLLAESQTGVAHCPSSNMILGSGSAPIAELLAAGVTVGLGTDGSASSDAASMLLSRVRGGAASMSAATAFDMATRAGGAVIGRAELGTLEVGAPADLVTWDLERPEFAGAITDPVAALLRTGPHRPRDVIVGGGQVVRDGQLTAEGLGERLHSHRQSAKAVQCVTSFVATDEQPLGAGADLDGM